MDTTPSLNVLVSKSVSASVSLPSEDSVSIFVETDPIEKILEILRKETEILTGFLLFLTPEELPTIQELFEGYSRDSLVHSSVVVNPGGNGGFDPSPYRNVIGYRSSHISLDEFRFYLRRMVQDISERDESEKSKPSTDASVEDALKDQEALIRIGKSLSLERDQDKLLRTILYLSKKITGADAGSLFLIEENENKENEKKEKRLRFKYSHTFSMPLHYEEFTLPFDSSSIAGYVAVTGKVLNIEDVYHLGKNSAVSFNKSFDLQHGYRTKSMLVVPMRGTTEQIIGVIQLINSKEGSSEISGNEAFDIQLNTPDDFETEVGPFKTRYEDLMEAVAGQAAIAIENNRMFNQIEYQFDSFVRASVMAIESRDPATSGHSFRVAAMTKKTAEAIRSYTRGPFASVDFSPTELKTLEFAGLLHDFGKVYIDPSIFLKGKKLYQKDYENLKRRLQLIYRTFESSKGVEYCGSEKEMPDIEERKKYIADILEKVDELNEPMVRDYDPSEEVERILSFSDKLRCVDPEGEYIPLLEEDDAFNLRIKRGSLNPKEREIIENHVEYSYRFVNSIPWPDEYAAIPEIVYGHHEKLDGSGYPRGVTGRKSLSIGARIMAIADIYDALAAADRPYKRALSHEKVIDILREEADAGKLDSDLLDVFIEAKAFEIPSERRHTEEEYKKRLDFRPEA